MPRAALPGAITTVFSPQSRRRRRRGRPASAPSGSAASGRTHDEAQRVVHLAARERRERRGHHLDALAHRQQPPTSCSSMIRTLMRTALRCARAPRRRGAGRAPRARVELLGAVRARRPRRDVRMREHPRERERRHVDATRAPPRREAIEAVEDARRRRGARTARGASSSASPPGTPRRGGTCRSASRPAAGRTARTRCRSRAEREHVLLVAALEQRERVLEQRRCPCASASSSRPRRSC